MQQLPRFVKIFFPIRITPQSYCSCVRIYFKIAFAGYLFATWRHVVPTRSIDMFPCFSFCGGFGNRHSSLCTIKPRQTF